MRGVLQSGEGDSVGEDLQCNALAVGKTVRAVFYFVAYGFGTGGDSVNRDNPLNIGSGHGGDSRFHAVWLRTRGQGVYYKIVHKDV